MLDIRIKTFSKHFFLVFMAIENGQELDTGRKLPSKGEICVRQNAAYRDNTFCNRFLAVS